MADAQELVDAWGEGDNRVRPHSSLGNMTPEELTQQALYAVSASDEQTEMKRGRWIVGLASVVFGRAS